MGRLSSEKEVEKARKGEKSPQFGAGPWEERGRGECVFIPLTEGGGVGGRGGLRQWTWPA